VYLLLFLKGSSVFEPHWPPVEIIVNGGNAPTIGHLKRPISDALRFHENGSESKSTEAAADTSLLTDLKSIRVFKYFPNRITWNELCHNGKLGENSKISKAVVVDSRSSTAKAGAVAKASQAISQAPFNVREGDLFCAFYERKVKEVSESGSVTGFFSLYLIF
jgi:hypothetical protein